MSHNWKYVSGEWWVLCDSCNEKIQASKAKHRWDGYIVCPDCFENRHPQDFIRVRADKISVPFTRPRPTDSFITVNYVDTGNSCTPMGSSAIPGYSIPGCMTPSKTI